MVANAAFATTVILLAAGLWVTQQCQFLIPYKHLIFVKYGPTIAIFAAALFLNLFALLLLISRKVFLKDTGRKLAHLEKQLRTGTSLSDELSRRLDD